MVRIRDQVVSWTHGDTPPIKIDIPEEQAKGITQVNNTVHNLDEVTQHNTADADNAAHIAEDMASQSERLNSDVSMLVRLIKGRKRQTQQINTATDIDVDLDPDLPKLPG